MSSIYDSVIFTGDRRKVKKEKNLREEGHRGILVLWIFDNSSLPFIRRISIIQKNRGGLNLPMRD